MDHAICHSITRRRRRHLLLTAVVVAGAHLALLSPVAVHLRGVEVQAAPAQDNTPSPPTLALTAPPRPFAMVVQWDVPVVSSRPARPIPSPLELHGPVAPPTHTDTWEVAQASSASEQSPSSDSTSQKASTTFKPPASGRLQFDVLGKVKGFGYTVSGELLWQQDGRRYQSRFEIGLPLLGSRVQTSQGDITPQGLAPTRFGDKVRSEQAAHFEREKGLISFSANTPSIPLEAGAQDRLSLFMQLAAQLAAAPQRYPAGTFITLQTVSAREAEPWTFRVDQPELLQLPIGPLNAIRLTRLPRQPYDQQVDLWFAPSMGYLPVRLRVTHPNGDVADQVLRKFDPS